jgi:8-oxo-dGTP pyrophosphatase MutT (NUDIX family)
VSRIVDAPLRIILGSLHYVLRGWWFVSRPRTLGAHAFALTPEGRLILVKLRYAPGWRLPGGGRRKSEAPVDAALRELSEEIGMVSHGDVAPVGDISEIVHSKRDTASLVIVRDVRFRPRWSWEIEAVREFDPGHLPADTSPSSRNWIEEHRPLL